MSCLAAAGPVWLMKMGSLLDCILNISPGAVPPLPLPSKLSHAVPSDERFVTVTVLVPLPAVVMADPLFATMSIGAVESLIVKALPDASEAKATVTLSLPG